MRMLIDYPMFEFAAAVAWSRLCQDNTHWDQAVMTMENWLRWNVGLHYVTWHWCDSGAPDRIGVSFRWDRDRTLFVLNWT